MEICRGGLTCRYLNSLNIFCSTTDQIAIPDFNAGAMENWGLITYRETALLYDPEFSSNSNRERIATIIAHELAHMVSLVVVGVGVAVSYVQDRVLERTDTYIFIDFLLFLP